LSEWSTPVSRRGFLKWILGSGAVGAVSLLSGGLYITRVEPRWIEVVRVDVPIQDLPTPWQGFTIAQLSDFHVGSHVKAEDVRRAVEITNELEPDLVVLTGDYVSRSAQHSAACARELAALKAEHGVRAILGNHDFWTDADVVASNLRQAGLDVLRNEHRRLRVGGADPSLRPCSGQATRSGHSLWLVGIEDVWSGKPDLGAALDGVPQGSPTVLLAHEPDFADQASGQGITLQLSGHSHGGQVRLPFVGALILPYLAHKYPYGLRRVGEMWLYTNRGVGLIAPPVRFLCRPEITLLRLQAL
jgi:predicted MPP superfamily phosphohydrolase